MSIRIEKYTLKNVIHITIISILTLFTQVGGIVWILNFVSFKWIKNSKSTLFKVGTFLALYLFTTFIIVPPLAMYFGRVPLPVSKSKNLRPHNYITPILNRHYVKPKLKSQLLSISNTIHSKNDKLKISYLDANFPFIDGFPLLPHLSHNDGKKVDLSFFYTKDKLEGNLKPSTTGYGKYVEPTHSEHNQTFECLIKGYWQYDFTKFITLGSRSDLKFDSKNTRMLAKA